MPTKVFERMQAVLNFLENHLGSSAKVLGTRSDIISVYLLASYATQRFAIKGKESRLKDFVVDFLQKVETRLPSDRDGYYDYRVARSSSPDSKRQLERRFEVILRKFLEFEPSLEPKDPQRDFDWGQKLTIYAKAFREARREGKEEAECKICGAPTPLDRGEPDHIKSYNLGGPTTVENGQWTCGPCNSAKKDGYSTSRTA